jgi:hypothetical protein
VRKKNNWLHGVEGMTGMDKMLPQGKTGEQFDSRSKGHLDFGTGYETQDNLPARLLNR